MRSPGDKEIGGQVGGDNKLASGIAFRCQINHVAVSRKNELWARHCCFDAGCGGLWLR